METNKIKAVLIAVLSGFAALYLGIASALAQFEAIAWVVGVASFSICVLLGRRVYLLLPILISLELVFPLPGHFTTGFIGQLIVIAFSIPVFFSRRLPLKPGFSEIEMWLLLLILSVVQAYALNPVGLSIFGSDSIGAKPYVAFIVSSCCAFILSNLSINPSDLKLWVRLGVIGSLLNFTAGLISWVSPSAAFVLGASFSAEMNVQEDSSRASRISFVRNLSVSLATWISSRISPLVACFHPLWLTLVVASMALAGISGYRSQIMLVGLIYLIGICYRGGIRSVFTSIILGLLGVALLAVTNLVAPLPLNIQRTLTFLPGSWDASLTEEADNSTNWRVEMWKEALLTDNWIKNKWFGDGLGFTRKEYERMLTFTEEKQDNYTGISGLTIQQESAMIAGGFHSGPVQTIRTTGYVGLTILLFAMFRVAVHAHRQIRRCRGTEWFPVALFIGLPLIALPFFWTLVFGTFDGGTTTVMLGAALVRMMEKNLPLPRTYKDRHNIAQVK